MNEWIQFIAVFAVTIVIHELGHIIGFMFYKKDLPPIRLRWFGIAVGSEEYSKTLTGAQYCIVSLLGVAAGLIYLVYLDVPHSYFLVYIIISGADISQYVQIMSIGKRALNARLKDIETTIKGVKI